ncbi:unnamed protein product, partial [Symbiodinium pilosum]
MGVDPSSGLPLQESDAKRRRVNAITKNHPHVDEVVILDDLGLDADVEQSGEGYDDDDAEEHESGDSSIPSELWRAYSDGEPTMSVDELAQLDYISAAFELDRLVKLGPGVLEELSWSDDLSNFRTLSTKMVTSWRLKPAPSGEGDAYLRRSRFVARDFRWMNHMMDDEVFAPASSNVLVKVLPAILVSHQLGDEPWEAMSLDVVDAYLTVPQKVGDELSFLKRRVAHQKPKQTPFPTGGTLPLWVQTTALDPERSAVYRRCVGVLLYVASDMPHAQFAIKTLASFSSSPNEGAWKCLRHLGNYLFHHRYVPSLQTEGKGHGLVVRSQDHVLEIFADSDWQGNKAARKSTSAGCILFNGMTIHCFSRSQNCVALSSAEAEYIACVSATCDGILLKAALSHVLQERVEVHLFTDSSAARGLMNRNEDEGFELVGSEEHEQQRQREEAKKFLRAITRG